MFPYTGSSKRRHFSGLPPRIAVKRTAKRSCGPSPPIRRLPQDAFCAAWYGQARQGSGHLFIRRRGTADLPRHYVYAKSEKGNLTKAERNALARMARSFFDDYRRKQFLGEFCKWLKLPGKIPPSPGFETVLGRSAWRRPRPSGS